MIDRLSSASTRHLAWLSLGLAVSFTALVWASARSVSGWQSSAASLAQQQAAQAADLLVIAIRRDMAGVQTGILPSLHLDNRSDLIQRVATAFGRYPYPEVFFSWQAPATPSSVAFYCRAERCPPWIQSSAVRAPFPVIAGTSSEFAGTIISRVARAGAKQQRYAVFDVALTAGRRQVVALLSYDDAFRLQPRNVVGFTVDLSWARERYAANFLAQIAPLAAADGVDFQVADHRGTAVSEVGHPSVGPSESRPFPFLFFDPLLVLADPPDDLVRDEWTVRAIATGSSALLASDLSARSVFIVAIVATLVLAGAFVLVGAAARTNARLAQMRSDFVSAVTHELKTPIATIRAISETLAFGRSNEAQVSREFAHMAVQESKRLTRLVDNLLAYSRITEVTSAYSFEFVSLAALIDGVVEEFDAQLTAKGFVIDVDLDLASTLPYVCVDRTAMMMLLGNLLDNAIRYSANRTRIRIAARLVDACVLVDIADEGIGIRPEEILQVTHKFFRGRRAGAGGSGLGLAIAERIAVAHGCPLAIHSKVGAGTTVTVTLPTEEPA